MGRSRSRSRSSKKEKKDRKRSRSNDRKHKKDRKQSRSPPKKDWKNNNYNKDRQDDSKNSNESKPLRGNTSTIAASSEGKVEKLWEKIKEEKEEEERKLLKVQEKYGVVKKVEQKGATQLPGVSSYNPVMIEVIVNDRLGKKERIKCLPSDTIGILKKLIQAKTGTRADKIKLQKWQIIFKDHITLEDYEIHDGMSLEMYYN